MNGTSSTARYPHAGAMHALDAARARSPGRNRSSASRATRWLSLSQKRHSCVNFDGSPSQSCAYLAMTWRGTDASHAGHTATLRTASACIAAWHPSHWTCLARTGVPGELTRTVRTECGLTNRAPASSERQNPPVSSSAASRCGHRTAAGSFIARATVSSHSVTVASSSRVLAMRVTVLRSGVGSEDRTLARHRRTHSLTLTTVCTLMS